MERKILAGAVTATALAISIGAAPPASAVSNTQVVGIEERVGAPNGTEIGYTVSKIVPSGDPVASPVTGRLWEATVMAMAIRGTVAPVVPSFSARAEGGANYPALAAVSGLSAAPLWEGTSTKGKIYFDVVGDGPNSVAYTNGPDMLVWIQPTAGDPTASGSTDGGGGGSQGVTGSTGPQEASPGTSGGEIGGGEGGTEGGGGNLDSGGGSGAPSGDTGGGGGGG